MYLRLTLGGGRGPSAYWLVHFHFPLENELRRADSQGRPREWSGVEWRGGGVEWSGVEWNGMESFIRVSSLAPGMDDFWE